MNERAGNGSDGRRKTRQDDKREGMLSGATSAIGSVFFGIPKFLFDQYVHLPGPIRTVMYIAFFLVFVYLLTLPRFLDGQLIVRDANSGGLLPYRGVDLQMQVEGRPYKFRSNEEGFFSVPIVGRWPGAPLRLAIVTGWSVRLVMTSSWRLIRTSARSNRGW